MKVEVKPADFNATRTCARIPGERKRSIGSPGKLCRCEIRYDYSDRLRLQQIVYVADASIANDR